MTIQTIAFGGEAGYGTNSTGLNLSKIATRTGYNIFNYFEYPSVVRGGHTIFRCTISDEKLYSAYQEIDILIALNQESMTRDSEFVKKGGYIIYDSDEIKILPNNSNRFHFIDIPFGKESRKIGAALVRDTVALGVVVALLGFDKETATESIEKEFKNKNQKTKEQNLAAINYGIEIINSKYKKYTKQIFPKLKKVAEQIVVNGNETAALASVAAGVQFVAIYPMTPITGLLHTLAPLQNDYGFIYKQPEDEISAINMVIGASFAGARSMTATSGGGYCLMTEAVGLAGITETPIVIIEGMRGGPSTGLPTWTEQGDLRFVLHGHQSDVPKIVLAPGDNTEIFELVFKAYNLAEKYQMPVIVMVDKHLCECHANNEVFTTDQKIERGKFTNKFISNYLRYDLTADGISWRVPAGSPNHVLANSDEHDEAGYTSEKSDNRDKMMLKRQKKLDVCAEMDMEEPVLYGPKNADLTIVSWGSTKGVILEVIKKFESVNFLHVTWMNPFPAKKIGEILKNAKRILNVENNSTANFGGLITEKTGIVINDNILKFDGRPFFPEEIEKEIEKRI